MGSGFNRCTWLLVAWVASLTAGAAGASGFDLFPEVDGARLITFGPPSDVELRELDEGWVVSCKGQAGPLPVGSPDLPVFARLVDLEPGISLKADVLAVEYEVVTQNVSVAAVAVRETVALDPGESITRMVRRKDSSIYGMTGFWPPRPVSIQEAWQGRRKLARVELRPVQYDPATGIVRVCRSMTIQLKSVPSSVPEGPRGPLRRRVTAEGSGQ